MAEEMKSHLNSPEEQLQQTKTGGRKEKATEAEDMTINGSKGRGGRNGKVVCTFCMIRKAVHTTSNTATAEQAAAANAAANQTTINPEMP